MQGTCHLYTVTTALQLQGIGVLGARYQLPEGVTKWRGTVPFQGMLAINNNLESHRLSSLKPHNFRPPGLFLYLGSYLVAGQPLMTECKRLTREAL